MGGKLYWHRKRYYCLPGSLPAKMAVAVVVNGVCEVQ